MRQSIVRYAGKSEGGGDLFDVLGAIPDNPPGFCSEPTDRQMRAVQHFYSFAAETELSEFQCHALLTYRDYARAIVQRGLPEFRGRVAEQLATMVACSIAHDHDLADSVMAFLDERFDAGDDPELLADELDRHGDFAKVQAVVENIVADLRDEGAFADAPGNDQPQYATVGQLREIAAATAQSVLALAKLQVLKDADSRSGLISDLSRCLDELARIEAKLSPTVHEPGQGYRGEEK